MIPKESMNQNLLKQSHRPVCRRQGLHVNSSEKNISDFPKCRDGMPFRPLRCIEKLS